jgi:hypothetical protein
VTCVDPSPDGLFHTDECNCSLISMVRIADRGR